MYFLALTKKGQVSIPSKLRRELKLQKGDKFILTVTSRKIILSKRENRIEAAFGLIKAKCSVSLRDMQNCLKEIAKNF